jgi:hypothetical protein
MGWKDLGSATKEKELRNGLGKNEEMKLRFGKGCSFS